MEPEMGNVGIETRAQTQVNKVHVRHCCVFLLHFFAEIC